MCAERATYVRKGKGDGVTQVRNFFQGGFTCLTNEGGRHKNQDRVSIICVLFWKAHKNVPTWLKKVIPYPARKGVKLVVKCEDGSVKIISPDRVVDWSSEQSKSASSIEDDTCALNRS